MSYRQGRGWLIGLVLVALLGGIGYSAAGDGLSNTDSGIVALGSNLPIPDFTFAPASPLDRLTVVQFSDRSRDPDGEIVAWRWDFGDGTLGCPPGCGNGTEQNPTHEYATEGSYTVTLTVTDNSGLVNTISKEIIVGRLGVPILITGGIPSEWDLTRYPRDFTVHFQRGEEIVLSADASGAGNIFVQTILEIRVIHPNGSIAGSVIDFVGPVPPVNITSMFAVGKNKVYITLESAATVPLSSSPLWLVRFTKISPFRLARRMTSEIAELQQEIAGMKSSWNARNIARKLNLAPRYAYYCVFRPSLCEIAQTFLEKVIDHLNNIDFGEVIEWAKEGLPELRGEIEALIMLNEAVEEPGKEARKEIEELYRLLLGMLGVDPPAPGIVLPPIIWPWPEIREELERIREILEIARDLIPVNPAAAVQLISDARGLLPLPLGEIEKHWREIDGRLTQIKEKARLMQLALRRGRRHSLGAQGFFSFELYPNPITSGLPVKVTVNSIDVESIKLQVFGLDGKLVLDRSARGSQLRVNLFTDNRQLLANGVYLYVVTVKGYNAETWRSEVRKLVVLR